MSKFISDWLGAKGRWSFSLAEYGTLRLGELCHPCSGMEVGLWVSMPRYKWGRSHHSGYERPFRSWASAWLGPRPLSPAFLKTEGNSCMVCYWAPSHAPSGTRGISPQSMASKLATFTKRLHYSCAQWYRTAPTALLPWVNGV